MQNLKVKSKDEVFMNRALELAKRGDGFVSPNPMVGAVIVKKDRIIAEGFHNKFGGAHAEIETLKIAKKKGISLNGSILYVNLEPCVHENKKTPPCVPAIIKSGISRVVIGMKDPNPRVVGQGIAVLRKAGIKVECGILKSSAPGLNEKYVKWITTGMPFVGMKVAMSLDGKIATKTGDSGWITGEASRAFVKKLRDSYDAILVGIGTVLRDNPILAGKTREPLRIILDSTLRIPTAARVLRNTNVFIVTTKKASTAKIALFKKRGVPLKIFPKKIILAPLLRFLGKQNISSVLVEGGSEVFGSFIDQRLVDKFYWFVAPKIIGGRKAKTAVAGGGVRLLSHALYLKDYAMRKVDEDIMIEGR